MKTTAPDTESDTAQEMNIDEQFPDAPKKLLFLMDRSEKFTDKLSIDF